MSNPNKVGLACAIFLGGGHLLWVALIALGLAQALYNFVLWAHMIHLAITIGPFDPLASTTLVLVTTLVGYVGGYIGSLVWNKMR